MKNKIQYSFLCFSLMLCACVNESVDNLSISDDVNEVRDVILKPRNKDLPDVITKPIKLDRNTKASSPIIGNSDVLLGYSYTVGNSIMGDYNNVLTPVVDVKKVKAIDEEYVTPKQLNLRTTSNITYNDFDRYELKSSVTKKVGSGFNLNLGLFKLGRKKTTTSVFSSSVNSDITRVYGELNLEVRNYSFALQTADAACKMYARECLSNTFMSHLYNSTVGNICEVYGDFVLTGYVTGGKAFGFYTGVDRTGTSVESRESNMKSDIDASFSWESNSASGDLNFGKGNNNLTSAGYKTKQTEIQLRTYGGDQGGQAIVGATELNNLQLDLSSWLSSVANINTHTIIDVLDKGLYPLSSFVLEENFKKRFDDTFNEVLPKRTKLIIPEIEIARVYVRSSANGEPLYEVAAILNTRQGDKIVLSDGSASSASDAELKANNDNAVFMQKANAIVAEKSKYFGLAFKTNTATKFNPAIRNPLCIRLDGFNENTMFRYKNPKTGIEYIYDTAKRIAFAHYTNKIDEDWILDEYGIRDWIESRPIKSISMASLANSYKIIGL